MRLEDLGFIGNCQFSALISNRGEVCWCCLPRFDSEPIFSSLLDAQAGGRFQVAPADGNIGIQSYLPNTNVLETVFSTPTGRFRVIDFAPRFMQQGRFVRPTLLVRMLEPLDGMPQVQVKCSPRLGWSRGVPGETWADGRTIFEGFSAPVWLATDLPLSSLSGQSFALTEPRRLVLGWGEKLEEPLAVFCDRTLNETRRYWQGWVKHCNVPPLFQSEVIRSALALKLHCFEDTGAIVAATTTSIPESPASGRTWDYRYCWLRDSYYVLDAFRRLGHFEEREGFTQYLLNIAASRPSLELAPLYRIDGGSDLEERILPDWPGFANERPVRIGNGAAVHLQNDIYGELVLALSPVFLDERFQRDLSGPAELELLERLARRAIAVAGSPDAGIWELRSEWKPQTFSSLMSWAGALRMAQVAERHRPEHATDFRAAAEHIKQEVVTRAWSQALGAYASTYGGSELDASLLQMVPLRFLPFRDAALQSTVDTIAAKLARDGWLVRYQNDDGLGTPTSAFIICTFWLVEALALTGRGEQALRTLERALTARSPLGLLSEHYQASEKRLWGNYPQAYSHVGLIQAAFAAAPSWTEFW